MIQGLDLYAVNIHLKKKKVMLLRTVFLLGPPLLYFLFMEVLSSSSLLEKRQKKAPLEATRANGFKPSHLSWYKIHYLSATAGARLKYINTASSLTINAGTNKILTISNRAKSSSKKRCLTHL